MKLSYKNKKLCMECHKVLIKQYKFENICTWFCDHICSKSYFMWLFKNPKLLFPNGFNYKTRSFKHKQ